MLASVLRKSWSGSFELRPHTACLESKVRVLSVSLYLFAPSVKVVPESKNGKEDFGCIIVNIMYCTAKLGYVEEVYFVNMLQGN